ncbi:MAG: hypothetical protein WKG00_12075 [Polyangiaceae bacterium]
MSALPISGTVLYAMDQLPYLGAVSVEVSSRVVEFGLAENRALARGRDPLDQPDVGDGDGGGGSGGSGGGDPIDPPPHPVAHEYTDTLIAQTDAQGRFTVRFRSGRGA